MDVPFQSIYINSTPGVGGVTGDGSNFTIYLKSSPIQPKVGRVVKAAVTTATIPLTFYGINSTNSTLNITESDGVTPITFDVTIPVGQYTSASFPTALNAALNAESASSGYSITYTCTLSTDTGKITFSMSTASRTTTLNFASSNCQTPLGIPSTGTASFTSLSSYTGTNIINIIGPTEIHIRCGNFLANIYETRTQSEAPILAVIPVVGNQYESLIYIPAVPKLYGVVGSRLDRLDFFITDENGLIINLNNFGVKIQLALYDFPL